MIKLYIYNTGTGAYAYSDTGMESYVINDIPSDCSFTLTPPPDFVNAWRWVGTAWVELPPINNPGVPFGDAYAWDPAVGAWVIDPELDAYAMVAERAQAWEAIKAERLRQISAGVYIPSIDKWLHTDELSAIQYAQIGYTISAGLFVPLVWKTVSGDFVQMTEALYNELQVRMIANTQANYARAEYHKIMMEASPDPLAYDFSQGWTGPAQTTIDKAQAP